MVVSVSEAPFASVLRVKMKMQAMIFEFVGSYLQIFRVATS
jgi:hypothetical protein